MSTGTTGRDSRYPHGEPERTAEAERSRKDRCKKNGVPAQSFKGDKEKRKARSVRWKGSGWFREEPQRELDDLQKVRKKKQVCRGDGKAPGLRQSGRAFCRMWSGARRRARGKRKTVEEKNNGEAAHPRTRVGRQDSRARTHLHNWCRAKQYREPSFIPDRKQRERERRAVGESAPGAKDTWREKREEK
ncbi:hypothetical protein K438DRAFT_1782670 [Mycena galopus ATCC 62051]|nr:hypothetical protein K438DRAFT_1782670 [Mycena galopus ATCC 62051]